MAADPSTLLEREKQVLRLLLAGHDAKSIASTLDLSTHVVNERLRDARGRLGVGSSRQAARLLAAYEDGGPKKFGDIEIGYAARSGEATRELAFVSQRTQRSQPLLPKGIFAIMFFSAILFAAGAYWLSQSPVTPAAVVSTLPANNAKIEPGAYQLIVRFNRPMAANSYSFVQVNPASYPDCKGKPIQSLDGKSFTLNCIARAGRQHEIWFNRKPYMNFRSKADTRPSVPYRLRFSVKS